MKCKCLISVLLAAALAPCAVAQMRGGGFGRGAGFSGHFSRGFGRSAVLFGDPFFYTGYPSGSLASEMSSPQVFLQRPAAAAPEPKRVPLLIELQGDHYVRFSGDGEGDRGEAVQSATNRSVVGGPTPGPVAIATHELPPAVLIFRDGR